MTTSCCMMNNVVIARFYDCYVWPVETIFNSNFTLCFIFKLMFLGRGQAEGGQAGWRGAKYPLTSSFPALFQRHCPHHLTPLSRLPRPKQAPPLDPTYTFSMSSDRPTSFCPPSTHANYRQPSFHVRRQTSLRRSWSTATPLMISVA